MFSQAVGQWVGRSIEETWGYAQLFILRIAVYRLEIYIPVTNNTTLIVTISGIWELPDISVVPIHLHCPTIVTYSTTQAKSLAIIRTPTIDLLVNTDCAYWQNLSFLHIIILSYHWKKVKQTWATGLYMLILIYEIIGTDIGSRVYISLQHVNLSSYVSLRHH